MKTFKLGTMELAILHGSVCHTIHVLRKEDKQGRPDNRIISRKFSLDHLEETKAKLDELLDK